MIVNLYKQPGETPLELLGRFKAAHPELKDEKMTYLGRLDPLASGVMLVAVGEDTKNREKYLTLDKQYVCEFILGFETDTYDVLGMVTNISDDGGKTLEQEKIKEILAELVGSRIQTYPNYSSKPVHGKPLWQWAREGKINEIEIPVKNVMIRSLTFEDWKEIHKDGLEKQITMMIDQVQGDFRQVEIKNKWKEVLDNPFRDNFVVIKIVIECSSGTYVRSLVSEIGKRVMCGAVLLSLSRSRVGDFSLEEADRLGVQIVV